MNTSTEKQTNTSKSNLLVNVLWSWTGQLAFVLGGFLLPRAIDQTLGKTSLGLWDFAWALVVYLNLIELGVSSSVNRYVALHLAKNDTVALNRTIASVMCVQLTIGITILLLTVSVCLSMPLLWGTRLGDFLPEAQRVVFFLGLASAIAFSFGAFSGVLTGCHRWDVYNGIYAGVYLLTMIGMLLALWVSGRLYHMAVVYAGGSVLHVTMNGIAAHHVCPSLRVRSGYVEQATMLTLLRFGGKTFLNGLARSFLYQASGLFMVAYLGPSALALYNRPLALVSQVRTFATKFAHTLTPISSELHATASRATLQQLAISMARGGVSMTLPPMLFVCVLGGCVLQVWMGPDYRDDLLPVILAIGHLWAIANLPLQSILTGMNAHGRPAIVSVISAAACAVAVWLTLAVFHGGVYLVASWVAITLIVVDGAFVTIYTCRKIDLPVASFVVTVWSTPLMCAVPFTLWLVASRWSFSPLTALTWGSLGGGAILAVTYWLWLLPLEVKIRLTVAWSSPRKLLRLLPRFGVKG